MSQPSAAIDHRLNLLRRHWQRRPVDRQHAEFTETPHAPMMAISREAGAQGLEVAREIGKRLGWPVYDREILDLIAKESGLRGELLETVDEHDRNWLVEALASFKRRGEISTASFVHYLVQAMSALAVYGKCIVVGRGAAAFLPRATTLRVRIVADLGDRVRRVAIERRLTEDKASDAVEKMDRERARFVAHHFHRDIADAHNFDLIVNSSRLSLATCADLAVDALRSMQSHADASSRPTARAEMQPHGVA